MNRTLRIETLSVGPGQAANRAVVLLHFEHPERGPVNSPAAPAFAADLAARLGSNVWSGTDATVVEALTYLDRDGFATGLAVAVHPDDHEAIAAVRGALRDWSAAMRTRRVLIADTVEHDPTECRHLDAAEASVLDFVHRGDAIVLIGARALPATRWLAARIEQVGGTATVVQSVAEAQADLGDPERLSYVVVPGAHVGEALRILRVLRARYARLRGQHPDEFCYHATDRYEALRSVIAGSDSVLLLTGDAGAASEYAETDPFLAKAVEMLKAAGVAWTFVTDPTALRPTDLSSAAVGLVPTTSASDTGVDAVLRLLSGLGPLSVRLRTLRTQSYARFSETSDRLPSHA